MTWELDLSMLTGAGIQPRRPPTAEQRADVAERTSWPAAAPRPPPAADGVGRSRRFPRPHPPTQLATGAPPATPPSGMPARDVDLAQLLADTRWHGGPDDLARNAPGIGITHEATRRRQTEGAGADRSWRVGADGEATVAEILHKLTTPSRLDRLRHRPPAWRVLHSVPSGLGTGRGDIDHVLIGPPGVVTINTKHHRAGRLALDGEQHRQRPRHRLRPEGPPRSRTRGHTAHHRVDRVGHPEIAAQLRVRPVLAIVGGRVLVTQWTPGVAGHDPRAARRLTALPEHA